MLWSALHRAANRESVCEAKRDLLAKYKETLFRRYVAGKLKGKLLPLTKAETLGRVLVERITRKTMSPEERRMREERTEWAREDGRDRKLDREMPSVDSYVLQKGLGFCGRWCASRFLRTSPYCVIISASCLTRKCIPALRKNLIGVMPPPFQADIRGATHQVQVSS